MKNIDIKLKLLLCYMVPVLCTMDWNKYSVIQKREIRANNTKVTITEGGTLEMVCAESNDVSEGEEIKACYVKTPMSKDVPRIIYNSDTDFTNPDLEPGTKARFSNNECRVQIQSTAYDVHNGKWSCVTSVQDKNITKELNKVFYISFPTPPADVELNLENQLKVGQKQRIDCIAKATNPRPEFTWYIGKDLLNVASVICDEDTSADKRRKCTTNEMNSTLKHPHALEYIESFANGKTIWQTSEVIENETNLNAADYMESLNYYPDFNHNGMELKCRVAHPFFSSKVNVPFEASKSKLDIWYPPIVLNQTCEEDSNGTKTIQIVFKAYPQPRLGPLTINGVKLDPLTKSSKGKFEDVNISLQSSERPDTYYIELRVNINATLNTKGANILNIINDMGEISYEINYCADNMATSVKVIIYLFGILFFVGLAGFSIFLINLRLKKNDQNRFPADEEISSSSSESNDNITTNSNQQVTSPYISAAGDSLQVENLNGSHVKKNLSVLFNQTYNTSTPFKSPSLRKHKSKYDFTTISPKPKDTKLMTFEDLSKRTSPLLQNNSDLATLPTVNSLQNLEMQDKCIDKEIPKESVNLDNAALPSETFSYFPALAKMQSPSMTTKL